MKEQLAEALAESDMESQVRRMFAEQELGYLRDRLERMEKANATLAAELASKAEVVTMLEGENNGLRKELKAFREFKASVSEALNSGDGVYRP